MMKDHFDRRFTYLRLSITDVCNFRCNYCLPDGYCAPEEGSDTPLSRDEIQSLVQAFALNGTRKIRITGGEPTLRKDLPEIIELCKRTPGIEEVALTSNGYRIDRQLDDLVAAGLDALNLSADSLRPETFRLITGHDKLDAIYRALDKAQALGIRRIKINTVLLRQYNGHELKDFFALVRERPVTLRFIELMQTGDNAGFFSAQHFAGTHIQEILLKEGWQLRQRPRHAGPALEYSHRDYQGGIGLIMPYSKNFCADCNRLRVSSNGHLHLCLFADDNLALRPHMPDPGEDAAPLADTIRQMVRDKQAGHRLAHAETGAIRQLAMIGG